MSMSEFLSAEEKGTKFEGNVMCLFSTTEAWTIPLKENKIMMLICKINNVNL